VGKYAEIVQFIRQTFNQPEGFIPLHAPVFNGNEKKYLAECIDSTFVSSVGQFVDRFEEDMAHFTGAKKAVVCVNGTNALHLALMLAGVKRDDEVITQPLTFIATANAISYCGANPVFIDVDRDTLGLSPDALQNWLEENVEMREIPNKDNHPNEASNLSPFGGIEEDFWAYNKTTNRRISAVVPMHTFGHPCRIDEIAEICQQYNIELVEDAAESLGSYFKKQHTGTFGKIGVLSFNGNKIITAGGGGMLLFNDEKLAAKAKHLTTQAKVPHPWEFIHDEIGYNYRMPNINAALGVAQLEQIENYLAAKRKLAEAYKNFFAQSEVQFIPAPENARSNYWLNCILLPNRQERDAFLKHTNESGIMTRPVWELMNRLPMFKNAQCGDLSNAEWIADRLVNIPSSVIG
jgi:dTDP-4-amino-4,6-dideoxygalactose transaminase